MHFMFERCKKAGHQGYCDPVVMDTMKKYHNNQAELLPSPEEIDGKCEACKHFVQEEPAFAPMPAGG